MVWVSWGDVGAWGQPLVCFRSWCPSPQATLQAGPNLGLRDTSSLSLEVAPREVALLAEPRGQGLGRRLVSHLEQLCRAAHQRGLW